MLFYYRLFLPDRKTKSKGYLIFLLKKFFIYFAYSSKNNELTFFLERLCESLI